MPNLPAFGRKMPTHTEGNPINDRRHPYPPIHKILQQNLLNPPHFQEKMLPPPHVLPKKDKIWWYPPKNWVRF